MTSEVLILNKKAVVIGADSAVTSMVGGKHPRYSKSADKLFELSANGSVAVMIHGSASIDGVPWEVAIKLFRAELGARTFPTVNDYATALLSFLSCNERLFPAASRALALSAQINAAIKEVAKLAGEGDPTIFDLAVPLARRQVAWSTQAQRLHDMLAPSNAPPLSSTPSDQALPDLEPWRAIAADRIEKIATLAGIDVLELSNLALRFFLGFPEIVSGSSGVVLAGYGEAQVFPAYVQLDVFGHSGDRLFYRTVRDIAVGRDQLASIQCFAKTSAMDMFTRGFDHWLEVTTETQCRHLMADVIDRLASSGIEIPPQLSQAVGVDSLASCMESWKAKSSQRHLTPLMRALQTFSPQEMAQLVEALIGLECLKERVSSPAETVSWPIDVAAITKSDGLIWMRRKPDFDSAINPRHTARLARTHT